MTFPIPTMKFLSTCLAITVATVVLAACGGGGGASAPSGSTDSGTQTQPASTLEVFVGTLAGAGAVDATGAAARFSSPTGVAVDAAGNTYVADYGNNVVRKITSGGVVSTFAGSPGLAGSSDGVGSAARFNGPIGVAVDASGHVYVADFGNDTVREITPAGVVSTLAGTVGLAGAVDGGGSAASFSGPYGVAVDASGDVYVADSGNQTIRRITSTGVVSTLAGTAGTVGSADGAGPAATFNRPVGVATDASGNVYVADALNSTIRKIDASGDVTTIAGTAGVFGSADGNGASSSFSGPSGLAADGAGNVYVADYGNNTIRKITPAGTVSTLAGMAGVVGSADGSGSAARFDGALAVATDGAGNLAVADYGNDTIRSVSAAGTVSTLAGSAAMTGSVDGTGVAAQFSEPTGEVTDSAGNLYVVDRFNNTVRMITPAGVTTTLAGTPGASGSDDGTGAAASFNEPVGIAIDQSRNLYVADFGNHTIRKITQAGVVTTLAGNAGSPGSADGIGAGASFNDPAGVAVDTSGNVYVTDSGNDTIRKVTSAGVVTTLSGTAGVAGSADGAAASASFNGPVGIAIDASRNLYVTDYGNGTIRVVTAAGNVSTLAGTAGVVGSADGTGAAASFDAPFGIAIDAAGHLFVADFGNDTIREVTLSGVVTTLAGVVGQLGFAGASLPGLLESPLGVAVSGTSLYITAGNGVAVLGNLP